MPTTNTMNLPSLSTEEFALLKEVANATPALAELQNSKKIRMVTHFQQRHSEKPPMPGTTKNQQKKTLNGVKSSLVVRQNEDLDNQKGFPDNNLLKTAGENIMKNQRFGGKRDIKTPDNAMMRAPKSIMSTHKGTESTTNFTIGGDAKTRVSNHYAITSNNHTNRNKARSLSKNAS
jgi:hypothetical protein